MAGTISSLGIGSNVLTSDVIDKLKAADTAGMITPITNKITLQQQKGQALTLLNSLLSTFKSSVDALGNDTLYQSRSVSGNTSNVSVSAASGVSVQSFNISNTQLALNDVKESGAFSSTSTTVATGSGTLTLTSGGISYGVAYTSSMTLDELKDAINAQAGSKIKASTLQVGTNDYRLVLRSADTGAAQAITLSDSSGGTLDTKLYSTYDATTNPTGVQSIQTAQDASFKYNGITLTRSSNTITDIITGVTVNLLADSTSTANIAITQDVAAVSSEMTNLVQSYNTLTGQLRDMTTTDVAAGKVGVFNGDSSINAISREVTRLMTSMDSNGNSLAQYGIDLNESGTMSFNSATFTTKYNTDVAASNDFFSNVADDTNKVDGVFTRLGTLMTRYTGSGGVMSNLTSGSDAALKSLNANKTRAQALLDARYEAMTARFVQYDSIISKLNNQFSSLSQQISMAVNGTSN
ncbi:flagellar filament capping protein FliD [Sulfuricurvum sp.]|uniref:flagellar filament capping protein FliD n=1 Tax=Sulfuricurvum sp. TaxID=2025608 RepID=UPI002E330820|nr:flagellar filament capping protein FliD [Sulfuricurvum sp.]HEX5330386.1 flagellar filament capping protein FliD [Sulfuricurvum sp.]